MPHGVESLSPILHRRTLKPKDTPQLDQYDTAILVIRVQSVCLESKVSRASPGEEKALLQLSRRGGDMALALNFGQKKRAFRRPPGCSSFPVKEERFL